MTGQEALRIIDRLLEQHQRGALKTIQAAIVSQVWKGDSYKTIGRELVLDGTNSHMIRGELVQKQKHKSCQDLKPSKST
jgi:hypothetical protein